jgi:hypothetical protein
MAIAESDHYAGSPWRSLRWSLAADRRV